MTRDRQFRHYIPTDVYFGRGIINELPDIVRTMRPKRLLIVTGRNIYAKTRIISSITKKLKGYRIKICADVTSNPDIEQVEMVIGVIRRFRADAVIGIGGGSVLDLAKASARLWRVTGNIRRYFLKARIIKDPGLPMIAIPTTAGTSSEVTPFSVITFPEKQTKITLHDEQSYPCIAVVDPDLMLTAPGHVIASSGLDVLSHAFEAFWNKRSTPITDLYAVRSIQLVFAHLKNAFAGPRPVRIVALEKMALAALCAGYAFSQTKTTGPHAISYPLTTLFGIPHGLACSLTLAEFFQYNARSLKPKMHLLKDAVHDDRPARIAGKIKRLMRSVGCKTRLRDYGITVKDIPVILKQAYLPEKFKGNPRTITRHCLKRIIRTVL